MMEKDSDPGFVTSPGCVLMEGGRDAASAERRLVAFN